MTTARPVTLRTQAGVQIGGVHVAAQSALTSMPLLVALHGGTYNHRYFEVAGGPAGSFLDVSVRNGFDVLALDRPGYGESTLLPEAENTFARQAEILDEAIASFVAEQHVDSVVLVGHSIGGMIALEVAARHPGWHLAGVACSGMGARIPPGGAAEQLGALPLSGVVDLPVEEREPVMFGPAGTFTDAAREAAKVSYAPAPFVELVEAPSWARTRLSEVAGLVEVPVHNQVAEFDALWDPSPDALADFVSRFATGTATSQVVPGSGHCIDHHLCGAAAQLRQLAFAYACSLR